MNQWEKIRYSRHTIIAELGDRGQSNIINSKILVIGAGGLGSSCLLYLASGGVGNIGVIDHDIVEESNLQRQVIHEESDLGMSKAESAVDKIRAINPSIKTDIYKAKLTAENIEGIIDKYDIIIDGSDNIETRFLVNKNSFLQKKILVTAAILRFEGQISAYNFTKGEGPCYNCLFDENMPVDAIPSCKENGIFSPLAGIMGSMQANQALKIAAGEIGDIFDNLITIDSLNMKFRKIKINQDFECKVCG
jgi:adenylyltransferase/sulfurtransferase